MHFLKPRINLAAMMVALAGAFGGDRGVPTVMHQPQTPRTKKSRPARSRWFAGNRSNNIAHQGARECARRRGGQDWLDFRAADRVRRGLPVSWPYQRGEA